MIDVFALIGEWFEVGSIPQVTTDSLEVPPTLGLHAVAEMLNRLEMAVGTIRGITTLGLVASRINGESVE